MCRSSNLVQRFLLLYQALMGNLLSSTICLLWVLQSGSRWARGNFIIPRYRWCASQHPVKIKRVLFSEITFHGWWHILFDWPPSRRLLCRSRLRHCKSYELIATKNTVMLFNNVIVKMTKGACHSFFWYDTNNRFIIFSPHNYIVWSVSYQITIHELAGPARQLLFGMTTTKLLKDTFLRHTFQMRPFLCPAFCR